MSDSDELDTFMRAMAAAPARGDLIHRADTFTQERGDMFAGRYQLVERLGAGGHATVWRAVDEETGETAAIKLLHHKGAHCELARQRLEREGATLSSLTHPNIVRLLAQGTDEVSGQNYLVMDIVAGLPLSSDGLELPEVLRLFDQLLGALAYAHAQGVVHRDLKPANVMVDTRSSPSMVKVLDFGIMRGDESMATRVDQASWSTVEGDPMGTLHYMSPEQACGDNEAVGPASDLYSVGIMLYEALSGQLPFHPPAGGKWMDLAHLHVESAPPPLALLPRFEDDAAAPGLKALVEGLLRKGYCDRPETACDVRRSLRAMAGAQRLPDISPAHDALSPELSQLTGWVKDARPHAEAALLFDADATIEAGTKSIATAAYQDGTARVVRIGLNQGLLEGVRSMLVAYLRMSNPRRNKEERIARILEVLRVSEELAERIARFLGGKGPKTDPLEALAFSCETLAAMTRRPSPRTLLLRLRGNAAEESLVAAWIHDVLYHASTTDLPIRVLWTLDSASNRRFVRLLARDPRVRTVALPDANPDSDGLT